MDLRFSSQVRAGLTSSRWIWFFFIDLALDLNLAAEAVLAFALAVAIGAALLSFLALFLLTGWVASRPGTTDRAGDATLDIRVHATPVSRCRPFVARAHVASLLLGTRLPGSGAVAAAWVG